jgi:hypothetical protein
VKYVVEKCSTLNIEFAYRRLFQKADNLKNVMLWMYF